MALKASLEAKGAYFNAISLGIPNLRESAMTRWKWVKAAPEPMKSGERLYQIREADKELRRHIRSSPDDVDALETLILIARELKNDPAELNSQLARAKARRKLRGGTPARATSVTKDHTGLSFENRCLELVTTLGFRVENTQVT
ncbi:MAG: hypothetical protein ABIU97_05695, partial [Dehalococcoidia bacterium]